MTARQLTPIKIIPVINHKGGVGKTTTTVNLAAGLARLGHRVLLVDLDGQRSASLHLGLDRRHTAPTSASVLFGEARSVEAILPTTTPGLDLMPGSMALAQADFLLSGTSTPLSGLTRALEPLRDRYDFILLDCAPTLSLINLNVIVAADALVVPLVPSYLAMEGLQSFLDMTRLVWKARGNVTPVLGIALTLCDDEQDSYVEQIDREYGGKVFRSTIPACEEAVQASRLGQTLFETAPESPCALAYQELAEEVARRATIYSNVFTDSRCPPDLATESAIAEAALGQSLPVAELVEVDRSPAPSAAAETLPNMLEPQF